MHAVLRRARRWCAIVFVAAVALKVRAETPEAPPPAPTAEERLEKMLDSPGKCDFREATLAAVAAWLAETYHVPVVLDTKELEQNGLGPGTTVSLALASDRFSTVLARLLAPLDLGYTTTGGVLSITTVEKANHTTYVRAYEVADLVRNEPDDPPDDWDYDSLIELAINVVQPDSWDQNGGNGSVSPYAGTLTVAQTRDVHVRLRDLFGVLRSVRDRQRTGQFVPSRVVGLTPGGESLRRALDAPAQLDAQEMPLSQFADAVARQVSIRVDLDVRELEQAGIAQDGPVSCPVHGTSLRVALEQTLGPLDVSYYLAGDVLVITTEDMASNELDTVVYAVADLLATGDADDADFGSLIDALVNTCSPDAWDEAGGKGTISPLPNGKLLAVSQTHEVHRQLEDVLDQWRRMRAARPGVPVADAQPDRQRIEVYPIRDTTGASKEPIDRSETTAAEVAKLIAKWVQVPDWTADDDTVQVIGARIVVKAPPAVQRQVRKLIDKVGVGPPKYGAVVGRLPRGMGGAGGASAAPFGDTFR